MDLMKRIFISAMLLNKRIFTVCSVKTVIIIFPTTHFKHFPSMELIFFCFVDN